MAMIKSIKRQLNKTPIQNSSTIVRSINELSEDLLLEILTAQHIGEGVFGIEQFSTKDSNELYYFTPALQRISVGQESSQVWNWSQESFHKHLKCLEINLTQPTFLPLYTNIDTSILNDLRLLSNNHVNIFSQLLFTKRIDNWRDKVVGQYEDFLRGNDYPSTKKLTRLIQMGAIKTFEKLEGSKLKREPIEDIESKILDEGYRAEIRIIIMSDKEKLLDQTKNELSILLKDYDYFNELEISEFNKSYKKDFLINIEQRKFSTDSLNQIFSFNELQTIILPDTSIQSTVTIPQRETHQIVGGDTSTSLSNHNIPLHLLPVGDKKDREVDNEIVAELPVALRKAKAIRTNNIDILDVEMGATVQRITCKIPDDLVYSDIKGRYEDIKASLGADISIIQGKEANTVTFLIPCSVRETVYLRELLDNERFLEYAKEKELPFVAGIDMYNQPVYKCLTEAPHLLIAGATNSGKSVFLNALLITWILLKSPDELRLILIDPKMVELTQYKSMAHVENVITEMDMAIKTLDNLVEEMEKRYEKMSKAGVKKITKYNKKVKEKMPYVICVIDEFNDLKMAYPDVEQYIERLGQKARASGIHLILATQRPDKDVVSGVIKTNLPSRISFSLSNNNEYRTVFGVGIPYKNLLGLGDGVISYVGQTDQFIRFQAPLVTVDDEDIEEKTYENIKKFYKGEIVSNLELSETKQDEVVVKEDPIDQIRRIIATTGETRIGELRQQMGIRINIVSEAMKELVEEGWLEKEGNRFKIIASEEELVKWRED